MQEKRNEKRGIVAFDLDHTLLDNARNEICPSALLALKKLRQHYIIALASGRDMDNYYSYMFRDMVEPDAVIHQNGTRVAVRAEDGPYDPERGSSQYKLIFNHFMEPELVREIVAYAASHGLCVGTTVNGRDYFVNPALKEEADKSYNKFLKRRFAPPEELWKLPVRAMSYVGRDGRDKEAFLQRFPMVRLLTFSSGAGADMVELCCSKAKGLERLCEYYGIGQKDTYAFGDSENDIEILQAAGVGVAVGNAMEKTKAAANYVTEDIRNDGIYKACQALGLFSDAEG